MLDDAVPIKPRDFLRRHPSQRRGYSVAQPFLGVPLMPDPNQPNQQNQANPQAAQQQAQAQQAQTVGGSRWQEIVQALQQFGPGALQFLELFLQHLQPTAQTAPTFGAQPNQQPADSWLENAAFNAAQAVKAKGA